VTVSRDPEGPLPPLENRILRARARGEISADSAFEALFREYARTVLSWLAVRVDASAVEDLAQDVWLIFYGRFRHWQFGAEMESAEARPVLSFLFRTCQLVARAHNRIARARRTEALSSDVEPQSEGVRRILDGVEAARALTMARELCPEEELDVLLAKLAGFSAREIARMLTVTEAVVDHRYRGALSRLREEMKVETRKGSEKHG
jgi:DNA-directed RNA polymerase specialized sigma24 family protein